MEQQKLISDTEFGNLATLTGGAKDPDPRFKGRKVLIFDFLGRVGIIQ